MKSNKGTFATGCHSSHCTAHCDTNAGGSVIKGEKPRPKGDFELEVPYKDKILKGDELLVPHSTPMTLPI